jgi:hypothetical protein
MRFRQFIALSSSIPLACCLLATDARACVVTTLGVTGYCDRCKYETTMILSRNEACEKFAIPVGRGGSGTVVQYIDSRIAERAKHGVAGVSGNVVAYKPDKDYVGRDDFVKEMVFRQSGKLGRYTVRYLVTVQ